MASTGMLGALSGANPAAPSVRRLAPLPGSEQGATMPVRVMHRAAIAVLLSVLFLAGCSHSAAPVPPAVTLSFCGSDPEPMPAVVEVICNTDDITARNLVWTAWGKPMATAKGTALVDLCAYEDCHTGDLGTVPIKLIASKVATCGKNSRAYTTLRYVFVDGSPWSGIPADMNTSNYIAGPHRTLPPQNQTVELTCG
jgi:hypothetical protein